MPQKTPDILKKIVSRKHEEIDEGMKRIPLDRMIELANNAGNTRGFYNALHSKVNQKQSGIIAEIKKASPSKGVLRENFDPIEIAKSYFSRFLGIKAGKIVADGSPNRLLSKKHFKKIFLC